MHRYGARAWIGWSTVLALALGLVGLILLPPFVGETARGMVMQAFAGVCHQLPARSPQVDGVPLAVCDRCMGIYSGLALGVLGFVVARGQAFADRHAGRVLLVALVPLTADWLGPVSGLWANGPVSRAATGALFGLAAGYVLAHVAVRAACRTSGASGHESVRAGTG